MNEGKTMTGTSVYKRKDGRWEARIYSYNGNRSYRSFYGDTKEAAIQKRLFTTDLFTL